MTTHPAPDSTARRLIARTVLLPALTIGIVAFAGCGSSSKSESTSSAQEAPASSSTTSSSSSTSSSGAASEGGSGSSVSLSANQGGQLEYSTKSLSASAGKVSIDFTNNSPLGHNVTIESSSGETVASTPTFTGGSKTVTATLKPGTYKFFCSVPGHRQAGMEGTLTVK